MIFEKNESDDRSDRDDRDGEVRTVSTTLRAEPVAATSRQIRARVSHGIAGVPPGTRAQTEVRA